MVDRGRAALRVLSIRFASRATSILAALMLVLAPGLAQAAQPTAPPPRSGAVMAQAPDGRLVLFGGRGSAGALDDTWTFDGGRWSKQSLSLHPSARSGAAMALAGSGQNISTVLFGGRGPNALGQEDVLGDTWSWDGQAWTLRASAGPDPRERAALTYHESSGHALLFGGRRGNGDVRGDTWTYDGVAWNLPLVNASPEARFDAAAAYRNARVVLFGGLGEQGYLGPLPMYEWSGVDWTPRFPNSRPPPARAAHAMAFDAARGQIVLFGGEGADGTLNDTWLWNGVDWAPAVDRGVPSARRAPSLAYHSGTQRVVLFGGLGVSGPLNDTWLWDGQRWKKVK